jgi:uncharacterized protein YxeA
MRILKQLQIKLKREDKAMFIKYILPIIVIILTVVIYGFVYEIKHAKEIDDRKPFLWDDYDEKKDKTLK